MELTGKVTIITGASSGLGQATAVKFAGKGATVTLCGRDQDRLNAAMEQCVQASGGHQERFMTVKGDVTEASVRQEIVEKTVHMFGRIDALVANAGIALPTGNLREATEETFDLLFNTNVKSVFFLIQKALPHLQKSKGNIVNVSSIDSKTAYFKASLYPMTKAAVDHMTRCMALDLGASGIRVNAVNPSFIPTRIKRNYPVDVEEFNHTYVEFENQYHPMGACGEPDDVADAVCFLASDAAKFITGQCLFVDGGRHMVGPKK